MADRIIDSQIGDGGVFVAERWVDQGDGTWARKVSTSAATQATGPYTDRSGTIALRESECPT